MTIKPHKRRVFPIILQDLKQKMVFIAGPRQCGKTTLAESVLEKIPGSYYNWDNALMRKTIQRDELDASKHLWVLDELHKFRGWRNWLKGTYDVHKREHTILVTGSAKLDIFRKGADSLQGRYYLHRLHPFTLSEYLQVSTKDSYQNIAPVIPSARNGINEALKELMTLGGFPEPLFSSSKRTAARWRLAYGERLVRGEIQSVEGIRDLDKVELLFDRLPSTVGSVLSTNSLREDLDVSFPTMKNWLNVLERFYSCFRLTPFGGPKIKAVKKEPKLYMWDWASVPDEAARFENLVALHLLRWTHWLHDVEGEKVELRYFRNTLKQEVDFIVTRQQKPWIAIEVKLDDRPLDTSLKYFLERVPTTHAFQLSLNGQKDYRIADINGCKVRLMPAAAFLYALP